LGTEICCFLHPEFWEIDVADTDVFMLDKRWHAVLV
jgi:hypothetical protein